MSEMSIHKKSWVLNLISYLQVDEYGEHQGELTYYLGMWENISQRAKLAVLDLLKKQRKIFTSNMGTEEYSVWISLNPKRMMD